MIESKQDYLAYMKADDCARNIFRSNKFRIVNWFIPDEVINYIRLLRKVEYYMNCKSSYPSKIYFYFLLRELRKRQVKTGFIIEPNCFGAGLSVSHVGPIIVDTFARIGNNCRIHPCTVIGKFAGKSPKIGNNVYIGPGAKLFGDIIIADGIAIGANSVVNKSFTEKNITIAGAPARKVSNKGTKEKALVSASIVSSC